MRFPCGDPCAPLSLLAPTPSSPRKRPGRHCRCAANRVLSAFGLSLTDWQGTSFLLSTRTGKTDIIEDLGHLWPAAERLSGRALDPLDPPFLERMEADHG